MKKTMNSRFDSLLKKYRSLINDGAIYFAPYIPEKKLQNVFSTYAPEAQQEEVLLLLDNTLFGNAKEGGLLTEQAFYSSPHVLEKAPKRILLTDIKEVLAGGKRELREIHINGVKFLNVGFPTKESTQHLISLLQEMVQVLQENAPIEEHKNNSSPKILEKDLKLIQDLRRAGATPRKFWEFILQNVDRQRAWEIQHPQGVLEVQMWKYFLSSSPHLLFNYWNSGYEQTAPGDWWEVLRFLPADPRAEAFCYFSLSSLLPFEREMVRIFLQTNIPRHFYIAPYIPEKKLKSMREVCQIPLEETIFGLFDHTLGLSKHGAVFGEKNFYLNNSMASRRSGMLKIPYEEFREREFQPMEREVNLGYSQTLECSGISTAIVSELLQRLKMAYLKERHDLLPEKTVEPLLHLLKNGSPARQKLAAWALTFFPKNTLRSEVESALLERVDSSSDAEVQLCSIFALLRLGPKASSLLKTFNSQNLKGWEPFLSRIVLSQKQWTAFEEIRQKASYEQLELDIFNNTNRPIFLHCEKETFELHPEHSYVLYLAPGYEMTYVARGVFFCGEAPSFFWPADSFLAPHSRIEWIPEENKLRCQGEKTMLYNKNTQTLL